MVVLRVSCYGRAEAGAGTSEARGVDVSLYRGFGSRSLDPRSSRVERQRITASSCTRCVSHNTRNWKHRRIRYRLSDSSRYSETPCNESPKPGATEADFGIGQGL